MPYYVDKATRHPSIAYYNSPFSKLLPLISHFTETVQKCKAAPCASPLPFRASDRITGAGIRPPKSGSPRWRAPRNNSAARPLSDCQKTCPVTSIGGKDTIDWQGQTRLTACLSGAFCSFRLGLRQQACGSKTKNHSKIHRWQVRSSFAGAEMGPDKKRPAENTCRIVKGLDAVWAHFCPSKPCLPLSIDGSVKGNRQGSLSRSITRRSDQNRKIKYCFLFCDFASACQKSPFGLF